MVPAESQPSKRSHVGKTPRVRKRCLMTMTLPPPPTPKHTDLQAGAGKVPAALDEQYPATPTGLALVASGLAASKDAVRSMVQAGLVHCDANAVKMAVPDGEVMTINHAINLLLAAVTPHRSEPRAIAHGTKLPAKGRGNEDLTLEQVSTAG